LTGDDVDQVFVLRKDFRAAQFAALGDGALLYEPAQDSERRF
jgi:hypothetical protein